MQKTFIILRGIPGSGKSSFASLLKQMDPDNVQVFSTDDFWNDQPFNHHLLTEAHAWNMSRVLGAFDANVKTVILDNTSVKFDYFKEYIKRAENFNYRVVSLVVENRHGSTSIHNVPEDVLCNMEQDFDLKLSYKHRKLRI